VASDQQRPETHRVFGTGKTVSSLWESDGTAPQAPTSWFQDTLAPLTAQELGLSGAVFTATIAPDFVLGDVATAGSGSARTQLTDDNSDVAVGGNLARSAYDVTGAGIMSDSFNVLGGMAADIADGNLPGGVTILKEGPAGSHDEGRAMADLVHMIAPGAQIDFYTAVDGEADFAKGIAALQAAGCNVIVDDVAYLDEPFFQDGGAVQQAVENAVAAGVSYFTAASNEGTDYVQQNFAMMQVAVRGLPGGAVVQNFGPATDPQPWVDVTVPQGGTVRLDMQWNQPFASIGGGSGSADSIGMALYDSNGNLVAVASGDMVGGNPDQILAYTNSNAGTSFKLVVFANGGANPPGMFKIINYGSGSINNDAGTGSGTVTGHEMVAGVNTVGAVAWSNTTAFGGNNNPEGFSSVGTGTILYGANGQLLSTPESNQKVNFLAPDGSVTSVFAPFYGTSAAAPDAAAVAALMLQANPYLTPAEVTTIMEDTATPVHGAAAVAAGAGLINAEAAVQMALHFTNS
jgi:subtilisin family serine protease